MKRKFINSKKFDEQWKSLGLNDENLCELQDILLENPKIGNVMQGTGRLRKMRYSYDNRGKSHSARVCYVDFEVNGVIFLLLIFAKNEMENLSKSECNELKKLIDKLEKSLGVK